jgi:hypothetical protein
MAAGVALNAVAVTVAARKVGPVPAGPHRRCRIPRVITRRRRVVATAVAVLLAAGCGSARSGTAATSAGLPTRTAMAGPVEVSVVPQPIDGSGAAFKVQLENHQVDLTGDYAATSTLTVGETAWTAPRWAGDGPGGHHRVGTLSFTPGGAAAGPVELNLGGLPAPVTVRWTLPDNRK